MQHLSDLAAMTDDDLNRYMETHPMVVQAIARLWHDVQTAPDSREEPERWDGLS